MPSLPRLLLLTCLLAPTARAADPATPAFWLDRADAEVAKAMSHEEKASAFMSPLDVAARLHELDPSPRRLARIRELADLLEARLAQPQPAPDRPAADRNRATANRLAAHHALMLVHARLLPDPVKYRAHLRSAQRALDADDGTLPLAGLQASFLLSTVALCNDLGTLRAAADARPGPAAKADVYDFPVRLLAGVGRPDDARRLLALMATHVDQIPPGDDLDGHLRTIAQHHARLGDPAAAYAAAARIQSPFRATGAFRAALKAARGRDDAIYAKAYEAARAACRDDHCNEMPHLAADLADLGDRPRAAETANAALALATADSSTPQWAYTKYARVLARAGDQPNYQNAAAKSAALIDKLEDPDDRAQAEYALAAAHASAGDVQAADRLAAAALARATAAGLTDADLSEERPQLIQALLETGRWDDAKRHIDTIATADWRESERRPTVRAQLKAGRLDLATETARPAQGYDRLCFVWAIARARARRHDLADLPAYVDQLDTPMRRAAVNLAVAETLLGKPNHLAHLFTGDDPD